MQLELPKRLNSILPILKWNLTFYFRFQKFHTKFIYNIQKIVYSIFREWPGA